MRKRLLLPLALLSAPLMAADMQIDVEIPRLQVAEYHRPYVAIWLEKPDQSHVADLTVWYDLKLKDKEGEKWLKDLRQWWRRSGRTLEMPVDGVSAPTRAVGTHQLSYKGSEAPLKALADGDYNLVVEAVREVGGRGLLRVPFTWPQASTASAQGTTELGAVTLTIKP
ncbi:DUF2271 domain-containing protein [Stutzerimonas stutzeri]|uniref:DUF2271 domain-containing protein n=1 Tax=Stutzerimonas stutzeri TaxID=316 RepID=UPI00265A5F7A|nr:DUF2271 domain-containing protein [Stutzerimonas stutzeri]MCF6781524.1 DUF2271 domain-containing protein [Stutzerimonas stutzeri]MCF6804194.1 DUF2271 domain-containing protein [Stutzerimonas stutzeri]